MIRDDGRPVRVKGGIYPNGFGGMLVTNREIIEMLEDDYSVDEIVRHLVGDVPGQNEVRKKVQGLKNWLARNDGACW